MLTLAACPEETMRGGSRVDLVDGAGRIPSAGESGASAAGPAARGSRAPAAVTILVQTGVQLCSVEG